MNLQDVSHIHIPDGDVRMIHDSDNRLLWGAVGYNVLFSGNTFQQSYTGKNLLNSLTFVKGRLDDGVVGYQDGTSALEATATDITFTTIENFRGITSDYIQVVGGSTYVQNQQLSADNNKGGAIAQYDSSKTFIRQDNISTGTTVTMQATTAYIRIYYFARTAGTVTLHEPQLEAGSTASDYEPYTGGVQSPNPDYPQPIQTVTGTQTISINGTDYPLNLGDIQLCGLGDDGNGNPLYKDYIYPDGEDWKIHKATASDRMSSADNWIIPNPSSYPNLFQAVVNRLDLAPEYVLNSSALEALCDKLTYMDSGAVRTVQGFAVYNNEGSKLVRINIADFNTVTQLKEWLSSNDVEILFALATATDTTITDQTLIAQLEAIYNLVRRYGYNFVVSVSGNNLPIIIDRTLL